MFSYFRNFNCCIHFMLKKVFRKRVVLIACLLIAVFSYSFYVTDAISYINDDPDACKHCHVMDEHYDAWRLASHPKEVDCNQCHLPNKNLFSKNCKKAFSGLNHSATYVFSSDLCVCLKKESKALIKDNCIRCHGDLFSKESSSFENLFHDEFKERFCWECHTTSAHKRAKKK